MCKSILVSNNEYSLTVYLDSNDQVTIAKDNLTGKFVKRSIANQVLNTSIITLKRTNTLLSVIGDLNTTLNAYSLLCKRYFYMLVMLVLRLAYTAAHSVNKCISGVSNYISNKAEVILFFLFIAAFTILSYLILN